MKQLLIISILSNCFFYKTVAQNLVPNYSFENYTTCPSNGGEILYAQPWVGTGGVGGVDYYNTCASNNVGVPFQNSLGYQYPKTGNAYAGLFLINGFGNNYREYLQVELLDSLKQNKCYYICAYFNLHNSMDWASNNMGFFLDDSLYSPTNPWEILPYTPQIKSFFNTPLNDTISWTKVEGVYVAGGAEKFLNIGNFSDDINTDTIHTTVQIYPGAYYYIDDVSVIPIDSIPGGMPAFAGNDTSIVIGDSVFIGQEITNLNCNWYNSSGTLIASSISGIFVQPTATTYYVVEQNLCGTITYDTVNVTVQPVGVNEFIQKSEAFRIFPNPSTGTIYFQSNNNASNLVSILIILLNNDVLKIDLNVENGVYFIHLQDLKTNQKSINKIVVNK
ncbi:MAG: T9SS type A sorting domain-containing protein [Bacteroidia bacterium]|nr:T9SS type A sorting domain-containing protein [Bacteroidia bacterium]